ncbi:hypothetical protein BSKO_08926 [Bryopsis sp. KO-2023]|nr:hypothetical protein BSKO_04937 [Bryopsis sp. KO-2023]GMH41016.1 hypothetical protein BSKO_08926 [Bryopsis sp. KO-2023]
MPTATHAFVLRPKGPEEGEAAAGFMLGDPRESDREVVKKLQGWGRISNVALAAVTTAFLGAVTTVAVLTTGLLPLTLPLPDDEQPLDRFLEGVEDLLVLGKAAVIVVPWEEGGGGSEGRKEGGGSPSRSNASPDPPEKGVHPTTLEGAVGWRDAAFCTVRRRGQGRGTYATFTSEGFEWLTKSIRQWWPRCKDQSYHDHRRAHIQCGNLAGYVAGAGDPYGGCKLRLARHIPATLTPNLDENEVGGVDVTNADGAKRMREFMSLVEKRLMLQRSNRGAIVDGAQTFKLSLKVIRGYVSKRIADESRVRFTKALTGNFVESNLRHPLNDNGELFTEDAEWVTTVRLQEARFAEHGDVYVTTSAKLDDEGAETPPDVGSESSDSPPVADVGDDRDDDRDVGKQKSPTTPRRGLHLARRGKSPKKSKNLPRGVRVPDALRTPFSARRSTRLAAQRDSSWKNVDEGFDTERDLVEMSDTPAEGQRGSEVLPPAVGEALTTATAPGATAEEGGVPSETPTRSASTRDSAERRRKKRKGRKRKGGEAEEDTTSAPSGATAEEGMTTAESGGRKKSKKTKKK